MGRGTPLSPEVLGEAARIYTETGNFSETARRLGLEESTVRKALARVGNPNRSELHARACARTERVGRGALFRQIKRLDILLTIDGALADGAQVSPSLEPLERAALEGRLSAAIKTASDIRDALDKRRSTRVSRARTKAETQKALAETELFKKKSTGGQTPEEVLRSLTLAELNQLLEEVLRREGDGDPPAREAEPARG